MRHSRIMVAVALTALAVPVPPATAGAEVRVQVPDLRIVGWTVDDTDPLDGNGDGGLHPGETVFLQVYLSNQGNETARNIAGTLEEAVDHPDVEILDKFALWPDLLATGTPAVGVSPHFRLRVETTRPCGWEIPLRLQLSAEGGYYATREFTLVMVDPQMIDLALGEGRPFYFGADSPDHLGERSIATADFDGDGYDEIIMGSRYSDGLANLRFNSGEVALIYGGPQRPADADVRSLPPLVHAFIRGADDGDQTGGAIAAGDLNGDGYDDLFLGSTLGDGPSDLRFSAGEVAVVYGSGTRITDLDLGSPPAGVSLIYGADGDDVAGQAVTSGDFDGDGFDDLAMGADLADGPGNARFSGGEAYIIWGGPASLPDIDLAAPPAYVTIIYGAETLDKTGIALAAGDLDGDGFDDLIVGTSESDGPGNSRTDAGGAAVIYGGPARPMTIDLAAPPPGVILVYGIDTSDRMGLAIGSGDLDGDGFDEMLLGAENADGPDNTRNAAGEVAVVWGDPARPSQIDLAAPPPGTAFVYGDTGWGAGAAVGAGDRDGDGIDDLLIGAPFAGTGLLAVIPGGARLPGIDLLSPPAHVTFILGAEAPDEFGSSVAAGDINGDGFDDLAVGAATADSVANSRLDAGEVTVHPGAPRDRYRWDADPFSFIDATVGTDLGFACDDCSVTIPIGFTFDFFGRKETDVTVSSNGYLTFGGPGGVPAGFCPPTSNAPNAVIAPFWDDLNPASGGAVFSLLEGAAPNRRLTIEWAGVPIYPDVGAATFEVTLFESSDQILFQYLDVVFGTLADKGGTAVVGVENVTGANGAAQSCYAASIADGTASRFRRFASPTVIFSDDVESGAAGFTATGLWHIENSCSPDSRSGTHSWYYGKADGSCNYNTGVANSGALTTPVISGLPQDAFLQFWERRSTEGGPTFDQSFVQMQADGGGFANLAQILDNQNAWLFSDDLVADDPVNGQFNSLDLSAHTSQDVEVRFFFDTIDDQVNDTAGWMVDDVTIRACPVFVPGAMGSGAAAEARATAQPPAICEDASGRVDAVGSYCTACGGALTYQWMEDGAILPGATGITHTVPAGHAAGTFDYTVATTCPGTAVCDAESDPTAVTVVPRPLAVGPTLMAARTGGDIELHWGDVADAADYVVFQSGAPAGDFTVELGTATSGGPGLIAPLPPGDLVYFLVAGRNPTCGLGPQR